jgi:multiple sugar transport system substrate-binding protein
MFVEDPKATPFRDIPERTLESGYAGTLGPGSAGAMADYVMVNMVAEAASGSVAPQAAAQRAERRARRYYR